MVEWAIDLTLSWSCVTSQNKLLPLRVVEGFAGCARGMDPSLIPCSSSSFLQQFGDCCQVWWNWNTHIVVVVDAAAAVVVVVADLAAVVADLAAAVVVVVQNEASVQFAYLVVHNLSFLFCFEKNFSFRFIFEKKNQNSRQVFCVCFIFRVLDFRGSSRQRASQLPHSVRGIDMPSCPKTCKNNDKEWCSPYKLFFPVQTRMFPVKKTLHLSA